MSSHIRTFVFWGPRLLGLAMAGFLGLFALDAFDGAPLFQALQHFTVHLIPAAMVGVVVAAAWRYPWAGVVGFAGLALFYASMVPHRPAWILAISAPLALLAVLFAISAASGRNPPREVKHDAGHSA